MISFTSSFHHSFSEFGKKASKAAIEGMAEGLSRGSETRLKNLPDEPFLKFYINRLRKPLLKTTEFLRHPRKPIALGISLITLSSALHAPFSVAMCVGAAGLTLINKGINNIFDKGIEDVFEVTGINKILDNVADGIVNKAEKDIKISKKFFSSLKKIIVRR